ncbi:ABC transporter ATP-binding protein [Dyadobacter crusticola]|uniref:ABC transporter ATP-binding protein n=1 Tax=Dyadobacter crusticola TaxID=292407 RepID=UPI00068E89FE|nr:ABC transporter ATP-binding protein [Dyadobacter crusticola]
MSDNQLKIAIRHSLHTANGEFPMEVSFALEKGSIMALTGPSGAGKTTLLKQIAGLQSPQQGKINFDQTVWLDSENQRNLPPQHRNIGFVFQDYALFPNMTVVENLKYALSKGSDPTIVNELLAATGLDQLSHRKPNQLSGGQQQRVALARALVRKPGLLLLDEPFSAVDPEMRYQLQELILQFHTNYRFTAIIVTHETAEIFRLADQVGVMENGKLTRFGAPATIYLNTNAPEESLFIHGEVLRSEIAEDQLLVDVLIESKIRRIRLPLTMQSEIVVGRKFALKYPLQSPQISWIS